jgi:hypothetical protein
MIGQTLMLKGDAGCFLSKIRFKYIRRWPDMIRINRFLNLSMCSIFLLLMLSCTQQDKDRVAKADLATKAETEIDFVGVRFVVENGIATLGGVCSTEKSKSTVETTVRGVYGVKDVVNNIVVGPVVMGTDRGLKQGVDSVLKNYAGVQAIVQDSVVVLEGKLQNKDAPKLTSAIQTLQPKDLQFKLVMQ